MTISERLRRRVASFEEGEPFASSSLMGLGTRAAVDQALCRLAKSGVVTRVARGVYVRPKRNRFVGEVLPRPARVAEAMAQTTGAKVGVQGAEAARQLGFSTQVPTRPVFYTTGPSRRFRLGQMEVELKHVAERKLALAGRPAGIGLSALWYLGKDEVGVETIDLVARKLPPEEFDALRAAIPVMPGWMVDLFVRYERKQRHG